MAREKRMQDTMIITNGTCSTHKMQNKQNKWCTLHVKRINKYHKRLILHMWKIKD